MKKILFMAALGAAALSACSSEEILEQGGAQSSLDNGAVMFSAYTGRNTRATADVIGSTMVLANKGGFGVFGYEHGKTAWNVYRASSTYPNFFYNQNVWGSEAANGVKKVDFAADPTYWSYAPIKYFSNNEGAKHSFFAYAPYSESAKAVFTTEGPAIRYTAEEDYDLLWAEPKTDILKAAIDENITFNFKHALSKVSFKATTFVNAVHSEGSHAESAVAPNTKVVLRSVKFAGNVPSKGLLSLTNGSWKIEASEESAYEFCPSTSIKFTDSEDGPLSVSDDNMVIPTDASTKVKVQVVYDVITTDAVNPKNSSTITNTVTSQDEYELEAGKAYMFCLDLGMTSVKFDATVAAWDANTNVEVDVPNNHEFHRIGAFVTSSAAPAEATHLTTGTTTPANAVGANGDFFYNTNTGVMHKKASDTWGNAPVGAYYKTTNGDIYVVVTAGEACTVNPEVVVNGTDYYSKTDWSTATVSSPATIYSLNVNSKGQIQTEGADASNPANWKTVSVDTYYIYDGVLYLWKGASH